MGNKEDPSLPNWKKTEAQANAEGWFMVDGDPTHWINPSTKQEIKGRDHRSKKEGK